MFSLKEKHILVIGGSRGIGASVVKLASQQGAKVSFTYTQNKSQAEELYQKLKNENSSIKYYQANISQKIELQNIIQQAITQFGELDGVVITAGIFKPAPIEEMTEAFWQETMDINLKGTYLAVQAALSSLKKNGGSIVIYTSTAGQRGSSVYSAYATSKGAQIMFMRSMAKELAPFQITCNCVAPGWTQTDMSSDAMAVEGVEAIKKQIPLGRIGQAEDAAAPCIFLLSNEAKFITGSTITVDGGFDMRG